MLYQHSPSETTEYHSQNDNKPQVQQQTAQISAESIQLRYTIFVALFNFAHALSFTFHFPPHFHRQSHHQHSNHSATGHHGSGASQSSHIETKYSDNVNGHDTLTDFVTFVCQETDNSPQSSQVWLLIYIHVFLIAENRKKSALS